VERAVQAGRGPPAALRLAVAVPWGRRTPVLQERGRRVSAACHRVLPTPVVSTIRSTIRAARAMPRKLFHPLAPTAQVPPIRQAHPQADLLRLRVPDPDPVGQSQARRRSRALRPPETQRSTLRTERWIARSKAFARVARARAHQHVTSLKLLAIEAAVNSKFFYSRFGWRAAPCRVGNDRQLHQPRCQ
jgi:hypothetical protein